MNQSSATAIRGRIGPIVLLLACISGSALAQDGYMKPPETLAALVDAPTTPIVSLSPNRTLMLLMNRPGLPTIAEVAAPELRLAGLRINPRNNGPSRDRSYDRLTIRDLAGSDTAIEGIPAGARIRNVTWSPDGQHIAFTLDDEDRVQLYVAAVRGGQAVRLLDSMSDVLYGAPYEWLPEGDALIARVVPADRGAPPPTPAVPEGPVIQEATGEAAQARTYQDLLANPQDEGLFAHYMTSQLVRVDLQGEALEIGKSRLFYTLSPSPDGRFILVEYLKQPFSYLVPAYRFSRNIEVWDLDGRLVLSLADLPLAEAVPTAFGSVPEGVRSVEWRSDAPSTLAWVEALDGGDARVDVDTRDRVFVQAVPDGERQELATLGLRYGGIRWGNDELALVYESWWPTRKQRVHVVNPGDVAAGSRVVMDYSFEDRYNDPGQPITAVTAEGMRVLMLSEDGRSIYLAGEGASPEGNRPFLRELNLESLETTELFRSQAPYYESVVALLDAGSRRVMTRRETANEPPNYFLRDLRTGEVVALTNFPHPYPRLAEVTKEPIQYQREDDGLPLTATLYLPAGYDVERDGPLPAFVWAYPREFKSADAAGQRDDSPYRFKYVSYWGAVPYITRGYAVIDDASMPIVGEGDEEPNDTFREQLVANAKAAIDEGVRRGVVDPERVAVGGHSYGAFMVGNLLAHSDLFRAGVARSGAYNRTLTPFGFQAEERLFWDAPEIYYYMSPFMHANKIDEPILLIHGEADNNSGTYPLQSERFFNALKGLGGTARLVMLPHESHGYRARESIMHMLWETDRWLEMHVGSAVAPAVDVEDTSG